jgi:hypothetical protein
MQITVLYRTRGLVRYIAAQQEKRNLIAVSIPVFLHIYRTLAKRGLKSSFLSQEKCLMMLKIFFYDPVSIVWFHFLESQLKVCCNTIKKIESDTISGSEVAEELDILANKMKSRRDENFCTSKLISLLSDVEDFYSNDKFSQVANSFSNTFLLYLGKWSNAFLLLKSFCWTLLKNLLFGRKSNIVSNTSLMLTKIL